MCAEPTVRPWDVFELEWTASQETTVLPEASLARVTFRKAYAAQREWALGAALGTSGPFALGGRGSIQRGNT